MRKNMVDVMKMMFSINKYSQVFNRVGPGYGGLEKFIIIDQYFGFPGDGYNFIFTAVDFHIVSCEPILYRAKVRL
jgi:hypothetical protein